MAGTLKPLIAAFLKHLRLEKGYSAHTLRAYGVDLGEFQAFCETTGTDAAGVDHQFIRNHIGRLAEARPLKLQ